MLTCLLTTFPGRSVHSPVKYVFFTVAYNIRPKFGRTFGTRSVSLPKPSASAECYSLTFGPSLIHTSDCITIVMTKDNTAPQTNIPMAIPATAPTPDPDAYRLYVLLIYATCMSLYAK